MSKRKHSDGLYPSPDKTGTDTRWQGSYYLEDEEPEPPRLLSTFTRIRRFILAALLYLPLNILIIQALGHCISHSAGRMENVLFWLRTPIFYSIMGAMSFATLAIMNMGRKPSLYLYVVGHELTHAIAILLCGGKISGIKIDLKNGSYVLTNKTNIFIALTPYVIPFWMFIWMFVLWSLNTISPFPTFHKFFYFGFGFWWIYHIYWTVYSIIQERQPDLFDNGLFFSLMIIALINFGLLLGILLLFNIITPESYLESIRYTLSTWGVAALK